MVKAKKQAPLEENVKVLLPAPTAVAMGKAFGNTPRPINAATEKKNYKQQTWEAMAAIADEIGNSIAVMAGDINESVEMVKLAGCDNVAEFNIAVNKTNSDFLKFADDFNKIKHKHRNKSGPIASPNDLALALQIFEEYNQFRVFFDGVMHHTLITFTEFALEAKDRYLALQRKEETTAESAASTQEPTKEA